MVCEGAGSHRSPDTSLRFLGWIVSAFYYMDFYINREVKAYRRRHIDSSRKRYWEMFGDEEFGNPDDRY